MNERKKFATRLGEFVAYSIIAFAFIVVATLSFAICFGLLRLVGVV